MWYLFRTGGSWVAADVLPTFSRLCDLPAMDCVIHSWKEVSDALSLHMVLVVRNEDHCLVHIFNYGLEPSC